MVLFAKLDEHPSGAVSLSVPGLCAVRYVGRDREAALRLARECCSLMLSDLAPDRLSSVERANLSCADPATLRLEIQPVH